MRFPVEWFIALRYGRVRKRNRFVGFIAVFAVTGIAVGITALIVISSIMNGLQNELRNRILGSTQHIKATGRDEAPLGQWRRWAQEIRQNENITGVAPYISSKTMMTYGSTASLDIEVKGVMPDMESAVSDIEQKMETGEWNLEKGKFHVILGAGLAKKLGIFSDSRFGVLTDQYITIMDPFAAVTPVGVVPRVKRFKVVGTFRVGMMEYDQNLALIHLDDAARFFRYGKKVAGLRLKTTDVYQAPPLADAMNRQYPELLFTDWTKDNVVFYQALKVEKIVMTVILTLVILVAVINVVSMLVMMVTDKKSDIAILRTIGAKPWQVMKMFMIQGSIVGILGTLIGLLFGLITVKTLEMLLPRLESLLGKIFPPELFYISDVPFDVQQMDLVVICAISMILSFLSTIYPAWRASRTRPVEVLRYDW